MKRSVQMTSRVLAVVLVLLIGLAAARGFTIAATPQPPSTAPQDLQDADGAFAQINGATIYYRERGPQTGPPVILVHGFLLETSSFDALIEVLAQRGYRVIAFDRPPFGLSDKRPTLDYGLDAQGDLTIGLMDKLGIAQAALIGHSAGTRVVANVAVRYPQRVSKAVLVGPSFGNPSNLGDNPGAGPILTMVLQGLNPFHTWAEGELRAYFTGERVKTFVQANVANAAALDEDRLNRAARVLRVAEWDKGFRAFASTLTRNTGGPDVAGLANMRLPVLVLWGEADRLVPVGGAAAVTNALPNERLITYPGCGHIPWEGCVSPFVDDVDAFLRAP